MSVDFRSCNQRGVCRRLDRNVLPKKFVGFGKEIYRHGINSNRESRHHQPVLKPKKTNGSPLAQSPAALILAERIHFLVAGFYSRWAEPQFGFVRLDVLLAMNVNKLAQCLIE